MELGVRRQERKILNSPVCLILKTKHIKFMIKITNKSQLLTFDLNIGKRSLAKYIRMLSLFNVSLIKVHFLED